MSWTSNFSSVGVSWSSPWHSGRFVFLPGARCQCLAGHRFFDARKNWLDPDLNRANLRMSLLADGMSMRMSLPWAGSGKVISAFASTQIS